MDLVFATECRLEKGLDGKIYSPDGTFSIYLWNRYLKAFDRVFILARIQQSQNKHFKTDLLAESNRVTIIELPFYIGPFGYLKKKKELRKILKKEAIIGRAYICRVPGQIGTLFSKHLANQKIPFAIEIVGDPWDVFAPGVIKHPLRALIRIKTTFDLRKVVHETSSALYVTNYKLQKRYPVKTGTWQTAVSNVFLDDDSLATTHKKLPLTFPIRLLSIGSLSQMYKSPDILLKAVKILNDWGYSAHLTWLGDGVYKDEMIKLAEKMQLSDSVSFVGNVPAGEAVRGHLRFADIFILASRTEGLPRAVIEAMAMGLPCIGTRVGGIPELLDESVLVRPNDPHELAKKIEYMINNPEFTNAQAERNLKEAFNYRDSVLQEKRMAFYNEVKRITRESISGRK